MAGVKKGNPAGFEAVQFYTLNSSNIAIGQASGSLANAATSSSIKIGGGVSSNFAPREPTVIEFEESDGFAGKMSFGGGDMQPFDVEVIEVDATLLAMINSSNVDETTNTSWDIFSANPKNQNLPSIGIILSQKFQSRETATTGLTKYLNYIIPICDVRTLAGGLAFQAKTNWQFRVTPTMGTKFPWGEAFSSTQGWTDNETDMFMITSEDPLALTAFTGDGAEATFITAYLPTSAVITVNASPNFYAEDGTAEALTSISVTTGVATPDAAPGAGVSSVLLYETDFVPV